MKHNIYILLHACSATVRLLHSWANVAVAIFPDSWTRFKCSFTVVKKPHCIVLGNDLQDDLHVINDPAAASLQRLNWSGPPPGTRNILKEHLVHVRGVPSQFLITYMYTTCEHVLWERIRPLCQIGLGPVRNYLGNFGPGWSLFWQSVPIRSHKTKWWPPQPSGRAWLSLAGVPPCGLPSIPMVLPPYLGLRWEGFELGTF